MASIAVQQRRGAAVKRARQLCGLWTLRGGGIRSQKGGNCCHLQKISAVFVYYLLHILNAYSESSNLKEKI